MDDKQFHPLVEPFDTSDLDQYESLLTDHRGRIVGTEAIHGKEIPVSGDVDEQLSIGIDIESEKYHRKIGERVGRIEPYTGPISDDREHELHFRNDAEFSFGYRMPKYNEYVGVAGSVEYNVKRIARRRALNAVCKYTSLYVHSRFESSANVQGDVPDLEPIERAFNVEMSVSEPNEWTKIRIDDVELPDRVESVLSSVERNFPSIRADYEYECGCDWSGTIDETTIRNRHETDAYRACPECNDSVLFCGRPEPEDE
jgi:hypothetical protein